ncbi:hypothetical protein SF83666_c31410 [Sinorhizobium fredii CCBAU 83666]|nr:hypothetical protein SF83666_c31410 [Sinorhizobium fredii CCBAU 83666]
MHVVFLLWGSLTLCAGGNGQAAGESQSIGFRWATGNARC